MPIMDGYEAAQKIREHEELNDPEAPKTYIVAFSGDDLTEEH